MSLENMMEPTGEMTPGQVGAIQHSIRIGSLLVNDHPEIAGMYRKGMTYSEIADNLDVKGKYGIFSKEVSRNAIRYALTGHAGSFETESYGGLIPNLDERATLEHKHHVESGRIAGRKAVEDGTGIHGLTPEQRSEYSSKGGRKAVEDGTGIHGLTPEQKSEYSRISAESINPETGDRYVVENGRKAVEDGTGIHGLTPEQRLENARKSALAKGLTPWEKEETEFAYLQSLDQEYQHQKGANKGRSNWKEIAQVLNKDYHSGEEIRSPGSVRYNLFNYTKTLGN